MTSVRSLGFVRDKKVLDLHDTVGIGAVFIYGYHKKVINPWRTAIVRSFQLQLKKVLLRISGMNGMGCYQV